MNDFPHLEPCPFCGNRAFFVSEDFEHRAQWTVECSNRQCRGSISATGEPIEIAERWNKRVWLKVTNEDGEKDELTDYAKPVL